MSIIQGNAHTSTGGYQVQRSLRFNSADSAYLSRTTSSTTNQKTFTWSSWIKISDLASGSLLTPFCFGFNPSGATDVGTFFRIYQNQITFSQTTNGSVDYTLTTTQVFRDPSAWYHIVVAFDTTQATATNRIKLYVNGSQVTSFGTANYPTQNFNTSVNLSGGTPKIGAIDVDATVSQYFAGYLTEVNFIDGQALTPSSFGETDSNTGVWKPKAYTGTYGTNGFELFFSDNSNTTAATLGKDSSGNGNNWTPNNFSVTAGAGNDSLVDSPTSYGTDTGVGGEVRGNYATWNPIYKDATATTTATSNGNLDTTGQFAYSTIGFPSGKFYFECTVGSNNNQFIGVSTNPYAAANLRAYNKDGTYYTGSGWIAYGATYTTNDIIGVAIDMDSQTIQFYKNGSSQGQKTSIGLSGLTIFPMLYVESSGSVTANFGQRAFAYTAPSGFKALCTQNLPTPTIGATSTTQANDYFNTILYTGTGSSNARTGVGFQPDFVWIKERNAAADHGLYDAVRGVQKQLESNTTTAETTETTGLTAFGTDGFTVGALAQLNTSGDTYVAWNWKANGAGSSNTAGTITSTVSANTTSGFSIVTYTGTGANATVGHGIGTAPQMVICKNRSQSSEWYVYHASLGTNKAIFLEQTAAASTSNLWWNNTAPTSTVFSLGDQTGNNGSGNSIVAYCFAPVAGYSAFGSYTGNGSTDGPFQYLGFAPAFIMLKRTDSTGNWSMYDRARSTRNPDTKVLYPNLSNAEDASTDHFDWLSNGFKMKSTNQNTNGGTFIYMAFAETPAKFSLAR